MYRSGPTIVPKINENPKSCSNVIAWTRSCGRRRWRRRRRTNRYQKQKVTPGIPGWLNYLVPKQATNHYVIQWWKLCISAWSTQSKFQCGPSWISMTWICKFWWILVNILCCMILLFYNWTRDFFYRTHFEMLSTKIVTSQWRYNERGDASNHRRLNSFRSRLPRRRSKKTTKLRVTGLVREFTGNRWIPRTNDQ